MATVYLTRIEKFNSAHKLYVRDWTEAENLRVFGKCANANWHGHNYILEVTVKGTPDPTTGFIIDAKVLSSIVKEHIIEKLDHRNLNLDVDFIPGNILPTTENLIVLIWNQLTPHIKGATLYKLKLIETDTIFAEYYGE